MNEVGSALQGLAPLSDWSGLPLDLPALFALAAGLGWAAGLRLYALVFVLGLLGRFGIQLPGGLAVLSHPLVIGLAGVMLIVEFLADKLPWLDSVWDGLHTFIRIPAGAALAAALAGGHGEASTLTLALLGGTVAAGTHFAKAGARALINTSPEPVTNIAASSAEDLLFAGGLWTLFSHPAVFLVGLAIFLVIATLIIWTAWRLLSRLFNLHRPRPGGS
ncbi:DUF4126 domain-containing protein [Niveibacterium sp. SC-1]|uniref:DUF4126 domain-containing protein n=1 Tax=Niveibacterium sp. SC-1 TaxID=3135646 RepID=UPI00311D6BC3